MLFLTLNAAYLQPKCFFFSLQTSVRRSSYTRKNKSQKSKSYIFPTLGSTTCLKLQSCFFLIQSSYVVNNQSLLYSDCLRKPTRGRSVFFSQKPRVNRSIILIILRTKIKRFFFFLYCFFINIFEKHNDILFEPLEAIFQHPYKFIVKITHATRYLQDCLFSLYPLNSSTAIFIFSSFVF